MSFVLFHDCAEVDAQVIVPGGITHTSEPVEAPLLLTLVKIAQQKHAYEERNDTDDDSEAWGARCIPRRTGKIPQSPIAGVYRA